MKKNKKFVGIVAVLLLIIGSFTATALAAQGLDTVKKMCW